MDMSVIDLSKPVILELHFRNTSDDSIEVGQWILIFDEILARKIGEYIFEVYPAAKCLNNSENKQLTLEFGFGLRDYVPCKSIFEDTRKYIKTSKGSKRVKYWEGPVYF